jgi:hypothetical protein
VSSEIEIRAIVDNSGFSRLPLLEETFSATDSALMNVVISQSQGKLKAVLWKEIYQFYI